MCNHIFYLEHDKLAPFYEIFDDPFLLGFLQGKKFQVEVALSCVSLGVFTANTFTEKIATVCCTNFTKIISCRHKVYVTHAETTGGTLLKIRYVTTQILIYGITYHYQFYGVTAR